LRQGGPKASVEDVYRIAGNFLFYGDDIKKPVGILSGGEKARLCLAGMLLRECNVLLLDEPTNHLDFETVETLAQALSQSKASIFFISHNREFIQGVAGRIIEVGGGQVRPSSLSYEDYLRRLRADAGLLEAEASGEQADKEAEKERRLAAQERRKEIQKECRRLQRSIDYSRAAEQKLLAEYEADGYRFDRERNSKLKDLKESIADDEEKLLELEIESEGLAAS
jgi:ATP-binding cassette subfamily F protein 3